MVANCHFDIILVYAMGHVYLLLSALAPWAHLLPLAIYIHVHLCQFVSCMHDFPCPGTSQSSDPGNGSAMPNYQHQTNTHEVEVESGSGMESSLSNVNPTVPTLPTVSYCGFFTMHFQ